MNLINVFYNRWNFGDKASTPIHYFEFPGFTKSVSSIHMEDLKAADLKNSHVIAGGGGILSDEHWDSEWKYLFDQNPLSTTAWGMGYHGVPQYEYDMNQVPVEPRICDYESKFDLHSTRDYSRRFETNWIPCASSMFEGFDMRVDKKREVGFFMHAEMNPSSMTEFHSMDHIYNDPKVEWKDTLSHFEKIVKFMKESELILTNSFHGMYWAVMAGVPVITFPFSTKFFQFKWDVTYANPSNWKEFKDYARTFPEAKDEARQKNIEFYNKFMNIQSR